MVRFSVFRLSKCSRRLLFEVDKKPSKQNLPVGSADSAIADMSAEGPGTVSTSTPFSAHIRTISSPGSEMAGIPASVTSAQDSPARMRSKIFAPEAYLLCSK